MERNNKIFAAGYFDPMPHMAARRESFTRVISRYLDSLCEVYYPWPGVINARGFSENAEVMRDQLVEDLKWCRAHGLTLDFLVNGTCYGDKTFTIAQRDELCGIIETMRAAGILPEVVTTASIYVAKILRTEYPDIEIRASVNWQMNSTLALEYLGDLIDSFYLCRDLQRDFSMLERFKKWADDHGKKMCLLANSGCIRNCPGKTLHETVIAHDAEWNKEAIRLNFPAQYCETVYMNDSPEEFLRSTWIRPEDIHLFEPYVSVFKLSTRKVPNPDEILKAYSSRSYDGDLARIMDPGHRFGIHKIDNKSFPADWAQSGVAGICANMCTHCGKCTATMRRVKKLR
ncbi:MAG: hypothetical protein AB7F40_02470 [Victivallaceae bacterium]|nr:hypothetical protein [Victivallaceae bacterium]